MSHDRIAQAEDLMTASEGAPIIAYQLGTLYPGFKGALRDEVAAIFERHGFDKLGASIREISAERALASTVGTVGRARRDGLRVDPLEADTADSHVRAWGVYRVIRRAGERASTFTIGARVFAAGETIAYASPVDDVTDPECYKLAQEIVADAQRAQLYAVAADISKALSLAVTEARALPFVSRGAYVAPIGLPGTARIVNLFADLRAAFYDSATRTGLRCTAVAVTSHDRDAVSDAVLDDLEERIAMAAAQLREEAGRGNIRTGTLQRRREELAALLSDVDARSAWLGNRHGGLTKAACKLRDCYAGAVDAAALAFPAELAALADGAGASATQSEAPASVPAPEPPVAPAPVAAPVAPPAVRAVPAPADDSPFAF
jgi:hypothetical protein